MVGAFGRTLSADSADLIGLRWSNPRWGRQIKTPANTPGAAAGVKSALAEVAGWPTLTLTFRPNAQRDSTATPVSANALALLRGLKEGLTESLVLRHRVLFRCWWRWTLSQSSREFAHDADGIGYRNYALVRFEIIPCFTEDVRNLRSRKSIAANQPL
jgi:hypothetical protein